MSDINRSKYQRQPFVVDENGKTLLVIHQLMTILLSGRETDDKYTIVESITQPGSGIPLLHTHPQQETFHILEGSFEIYGQDVDGNKYAMPAPAGSTIHVPGGAPHGFLNTGDTPGKVLITYEPAGNMERFIREIGFPVTDKANPPTPAIPDMEALLKVCAQFGIYFLESPQD